jgi:dihydroorotate dehydrogenase electron transfer subunit
MSIASPWHGAIPRAGQFVHIRCGNAFDPLLRRAFSIASYNEKAGSLDIIYRIQGKGTSLLAQLARGDAIDIIGPLGKPFDISDAVSAPIWMVGGGVGVPPLAMLAQQQACVQSLAPTRKAFVGGRSEKDLLCLEDLELYGFDIYTATEDGSAGHAGYVTKVLEWHLQQNRKLETTKPSVYSCGPTPMLRAVARICADFDVRCQISLEESMPCGMGVCNGCVVETVNAGDEYGRYRRICVDGPVMRAEEIAW